MTADTFGADAVAALTRRLLDLDLPLECRPGVAENLALLADHAGRVLGWPG